MLSLKKRPEIHKVHVSHCDGPFRPPKTPNRKRTRSVTAKFRIVEWRSLRNDWEPMPGKRLELDEQGVCHNYKSGEEKILNSNCWLIKPYWHYSVVFVTLP